MLQCFLDHRAPSLFRSGRLPRLEYVCDVDSAASAMTRNLHAHSNIAELLLVYRGYGIYRVGGRRYVAGEGTLIVLDAGIVHEEIGGCAEGMASYCLGVSGVELVRRPPNCILPEDAMPLLQLRDDYKEMLELFRLTVHEGYAGRTEAAEALMRAILVRTCEILSAQREKAETRESALGREIRQYLDRNYMENLHLADVAAALHTSASHASHLFRRENGLSPMQYVALRRIGEAQNLLINTKMSVTDIAAQVGYNNSNYFQNVFHHALGMTPCEYRRRWTT
ncbi:MAG: AraC family transcriptional regulator [Selenomonas sp.]|uniref:helix-turn-helix transcriptional regulator n=1 Tax=uncultured Selenomonas sp. TaxID=159275 RepID=UPI0025E62E8C|nr:AraC family transcriptional regulator [uncultured Selenomonas sp.]MDD6128680.1 AraC family transcriptional regulator [Veillonellaceae bacterium]MDD6699074.1 AraC family transcriptional regulator [Veillonellaceae bacterium]MDY6268439.1 AraC family transcriptional regulator [Selenomonadaceae bacterium]MDY6350947.1 AraC family transcriptional regulator [Selenomonas sp.]